jgi:virginiamycin B lyase
MRGIRTAAWTVLALCVATIFTLPAAAGAAPIASSSAVTSFPQPDVPPTGGDGPLVFGPDGQAWFTGYYGETYSPGEEPHYLPQIMRIDPQGQVGVVLQHQTARGLTVGPDGNVWLTDTRSVIRLTPSGEFAEFPMPEEKVGQSFTQAAGPIVSGPDGNLWFSGYRAVRAGSEGKLVATIDRMTPAGDLAQFELPGPGSFPTRLAVGPDGNVWFTEMQEDKVGGITPSGSIQMFQLPSGARPLEIVAGADGNLWVTEEKDDPGALGRITPSGQYTEFPVEPEITAGALAAGPDGRLWFAAGPGAIDRMTPSGRLSRVQLPNSTGVIDIVAGVDGSVWYTAIPEPPCAAGDAGCGQSGSYQSGIVGRIVPAPLGLEIDGGAPAAKGHWAKVQLTCHDGTATSVCSGRLRLRAGHSVVAQRSYRLGTDLTSGISLRLTREGRERLARRGHLRVVCEVTTTGAEPQTRAFKLKLPRRAARSSARRVGRTR